jgi:hypothetical protein
MITSYLLRRQKDSTQSTFVLKGNSSKLPGAVCNKMTQYSNRKKLGGGWNIESF